MIRTLYVDDEEALLELCKEFLERMGDHEVSTASSALDVERRLSSEEFDAIIADYQMPVMSGLDLLKSLRSKGSDIPFVLFTGKGREEVVMEALNSGADFYVQKGGDPKAQFAELDHKVRQAVERRRMGQELRKSEENYRAIFESASDEITIHDAQEGTLVDANPAAMAALGCSSLAEMCALRSYGRSPYGPKEALAYLHKTMRDGPQTFEWYVEGRKGRRIWQEVRLQPVRFKGKGYVMAIARDVTERKTRELALQSSEEKMRLALQAANEVTFELDVDKLELVGSRTLFQMMGYPPIDAPTSLDLLQDLIHPDDLVVLVDWMEGGRVLMDEAVQIRVKNALGQYRWLDIKSDIMDEGPERRRKLLGTIRDVTETKVAEEAAKRNAETVQALMDSTPDLAFLLDAQGVVLAANDAFVRQMGGCRSDIIGRSLPDLMPPSPSTSPDAMARAARRWSMVQGVLRSGEGLSFLDMMEGGTFQHTLHPISGLDGKVERIAVHSRDITEQLRGERALLESEERFREIIHQSTDAIILWDEEGCICEHNPAALALMGLTEQDLSGMKGWDVHFMFVPEERSDPHRTAALRQSLAEVQATGKAPFLEKVVEFELRTRDGSVKKVQTVLFPIRTTKGFRIGSITRDVTEVRRAESSAKESEERLRRFFDEAFEAVYIIGPTGKVVDCNTRLLSFMQLPKEEVLDTFAWDLMFKFLPEGRRSPERLEHFRATVQQALSSGAVKGLKEPIKARISMPDGSERFVEQTVFAYRSEGGTNIGVVIRDVTDRNRAEETRRQSEENYRNMFESLIESVLVLEPGSGEVVECNRRALELLRSKDLSDLRSRGMWSEGWFRKDEYISMLSRAFSEGLITFEKEVRTEGGEQIWVEFRVQAITYSGQPRLLMLVRNITERRQSQDALLALNRKLNLLSSITRHDILNQLAVLMGYLELQRGMTRDQAGLANLAKMDRSAQIIREQIEFTRDYEEMGTRTPQWQRLSVILDALPQSKQLPSFEVSQASRRLEIFADPMLRKVFHNLLENTLRHGGRVRSARVSCYQEAGRLRLVYEDDGEGIPADQKERIFEKGYGKGSGLGMFLSRDILAITEISIVEKGELGKGAVFEMTVPSGKFRFV